MSFSTVTTGQDTPNNSIWQISDGKSFEETSLRSRFFLDSLDSYKSRGRDPLLREQLSELQKQTRLQWRIYFCFSKSDQDIAIVDGHGLIYHILNNL